eukprot:CAMPEP_0170604248 /NCGR_PEP_ID=MMETSP0224-20130122/19322_1 /TAXON_ID=285029 /ORGANISM="Togula jolla, Strain CCCM 725" /LENGTH=535 /DNA_ID=CAMNT_0010929139 /DNA_START=23 /DNA_END=1630 /DNA_ORIENTATION=+
MLGLIPVVLLALVGRAVSDVEANDLLVQKLSHLEELVQSNQDLIDRLERDAQASRRTQSTVSKTELEDLHGAMDNLWLVVAGALVMIMQAGFALLTGGICRMKNLQNVLLKNITDVVVGTVGWYTVGFNFAYGEESHSIISTGHAFGMNYADADPTTGIQTPNGFRAHWFFQWAFCGAAATIVSGGVMERVQFPAYSLYSLLMSAFIYPVVVSWTWGGGWLAGGDDGINSVGYMDFAGSGIVHMVGGVGALVGSIVCGSRDHRWDKDREDDFIPHSTPLLVLGTFVLWFGWYGFNCGSTLEMHDKATGLLASHVAQTTTLSAAVGGITVFLAQYAIIRKYDVGAFCNGILAGLVSITAPCATVDTGSAVAIGFLGGLIYLGASMSLKKLHIDDPLDAFPVHGCCGAWGVLAAALFDIGKGFESAHGWSYWDCQRDDAGACDKSAWSKLLAANLLQILCVCTWTAVTSALIFIPLGMAGLLRSPSHVQEAGADAKKHSPSKAYSFEYATEDAPPKAAAPSVPPATKAAGPDPTASI